MIFIDGTWLYKARQSIFDALGGKNCEIDYKRIPDILAQSLAEISGQEVDIVRTCYYGVIPVNKPNFQPGKQQDFYDFLENTCGYEMDIMPLDNRKDPTATPDGKWIAANLASEMTFMATVPGAYDVAILVAGDADYIPVLRRIRKLGKRVQLVSVNAPRAKINPAKVLAGATKCFDFPHLFMDEHANDFHLQRGALRRVCMTCGKEEETSWAGEEFYCAECRAKRLRHVRKCDNCGREEETTWDKDFFYCSICRANYRAQSVKDDPALDPANAAVAAPTPPAEEEPAPAPAPVEVPAEDSSVLKATLAPTKPKRTYTRRTPKTL